MQRSCETVKIGGSFLFLLACLAPRGEVGRGTQDEKEKREGWVEWRQAGRVDGKRTASHGVQYFHTFHSSTT